MCVDVAGRQPILISKRSNEDRKSVTPDARGTYPRVGVTASRAESPFGVVTMSVHKLTAGSGYDYLTRQVAALDATDKGRTGLASYYAERGESPGVWVGSGMEEIDGLDVGDPVTAEQMRALFGCGLHPLAELRLKQLEGADLTGQDLRDVMRLGHRSRSSTMRRRSGSRWPSGSLLLMPRPGSRPRPCSRRLTGRGFGRR
jgi:hypothetical protein